MLKITILLICLFSQNSFIATLSGEEYSNTNSMNELFVSTTTVFDLNSPIEEQTDSNQQTQRTPLKYLRKCKANFQYFPYSLAKTSIELNSSSDIKKDYSPLLNHLPPPVNG